MCDEESAAPPDLASHRRVPQRCGGGGRGEAGAGLPDFVRDHLPPEPPRLALDLTQSVPRPSPHTPQSGGLPDCLPAGGGAGRAARGVCGRPDGAGAAQERHETRARMCGACGSEREEQHAELERLRAEVQRLRESESVWRRKAESATERLRQARIGAETSLRELVEQLSAVSSTLTPP